MEGVASSACARRPMSGIHNKLTSKQFTRHRRTGIPTGKPGPFQRLGDPMIASVLFKRIVFVVVGALVALAGLGVANVFGFSPFQASDRSESALLKSTKDVSEYHAVVGSFEVVVLDPPDAEGVPNVIAGRRTVFIAAGTVDAYVDLSGLAAGDLTLSEDGKSVTVRLPEPQLGKPNLDPDRSYVYMQDRGVLDRIADAIETPQQARFYELAEIKIATAAEESGLRKQADKNTKTMLTGMFTSLGIDVTFRDSASE